MLVLASVIIAVTPELNKSFPKVMWIVINLLWYFEVFLFEHHQVKFAAKTFAFGILFWIIYETVLSIIGFSSASIGNYHIQFCFFDLLIKALYAKQFYSTKQKSFLFRAIQLVVIINVIQNIYISNLFPNIQNAIYQHPEVGDGLNIAMTEFYNMLAFFIGVNFLAFYIEEKMVWKVFDISAIVLCYYFMLTCTTRATSLTMSVVLLVSVWYLHKLGYRKVSPGPIVCLIVLFCFLSYFMDDIINMLPDRVAVRYMTLAGDSGGDTATLSRFELIGNSIRTFFANPVFGIGYHLGNDYFSLVGQHSLITDYLAWFGIFGAIFLIFFFRSLYRLLPKGCNSIFLTRYSRYLILVFCIYSVLSNTFRPENSVSAFLMLSCLSCTKAEHKK